MINDGQAFCTEHWLSLKTIFNSVLNYCHYCFASQPTTGENFYCRYRNEGNIKMLIVVYIKFYGDDVTCVDQPTRVYRANTSIIFLVCRQLHGVKDRERTICRMHAVWHKHAHEQRMEEI